MSLNQRKSSLAGWEGKPGGTDEKYEEECDEETQYIVETAVDAMLHPPRIASKVFGIGFEVCLMLKLVVLMNAFFFAGGSARIRV